MIPPLVVAKAATSKRVRPWLVASVLFLTALLFSRFFAEHPEYLRALRHIPPITIIVVVALDTLLLGALIWIYDATVKLCGRRLPLKETGLLTAYSTIANFFGPLQSGPGVRAAYLKTRHQVRLRDYALATFIYYGLYAFFSALFLLVGTRPWWQTVLALLLVASASALVIRKVALRARTRGQDESHFHLHGTVLASLIIATFVQVSLQAIMYFIELRAIDPAVHFSQAVSYTGAANFSLFVSITPGAIGFREAFLVFSQNIHHISTATILSASLIDRAAYIVFLALLSLVVVGTHAKVRLQLRSKASQGI
jgi:uncharacterized membrane protein YbhN (UPF0104 family)